MGYTTDFSGEFKLDKPLTPARIEYLKAFAQTRRMQRDARITETLPDPVRLAVVLPVGEQGGYFVGSRENFGQNHTPDVIDGNVPPKGQLNSWCQWVPTDDGTAILWDEGEKFYDYVAWIKYLIQHFLAPWGYLLNGEIQWEGESSSDIGKIKITDNVVKVLIGKFIYE